MEEQEEQARKMEELRERAEHLQCENNRLWAQVKKRCDPGERDTQDSSQARHPTIRDKGKKIPFPLTM